MITTRGDVVIITASITFGKKDIYDEDWEAKKNKMIKATEAAFHSQLVEIEGKIQHDVDVKERNRVAR